ncbi:MAG: AMP-binding protein [Paludibacter sp.]|nr:AMP-binding protein [Paludibacter sp.]
MIPIWGSGRSAINAFQEGNYWTGTGYSLLAVTDVFLVKALGTAIVKGAVKVGVKIATREAVEVATKDATEVVVKEAAKSSTTGFQRFGSLTEKFGEDNEILLRGKTIFPGYYNNPEANKAAFDADGWFKTGDAGIIKNNYLIMTERIKDLFKTSNGKYIAPQEIETRLVLDRYIEQAAVIGDERNFVTAIIAPTIPEVEKFAKANKINYSSVEELLKQPEIYNLIMGRIKVLQSGMAEYEKIKKFTLIPKSFSIEAGELTNTLKVRRAVIMQKYKLQIEEMYAV